jgi:RNA polymerase sigma-70 factor (ECF subfamily)
MSSEAARYFAGVFENANTAPHQEGDSSLAEAFPARERSEVGRSDLTTASQSPIDSAACGEFPDEILFAQICEGDREALARLFRRFAGVVYAVAFRILRDSSEAEDLLQDVFLFIYRKCAIFDNSKGSARSWVVQMTYQRAIDRRRYLQSRHHYSSVDIDDRAIQIPDPRGKSSSYDESIEAALGSQNCQRLLEVLTADQRETIRLFFFDGYTFEEIAARKGQSLGNVRNHYYRGLEKIRQQVFSNKLRGR